MWQDHISIYFWIFPFLFCTLTGTQRAVFPPWVTQRQKQRLKDAIDQSGEIKSWTPVYIRGTFQSHRLGSGGMLEDGRQEVDGRLRRWEEAPQEPACGGVSGPGSSLITNLTHPSPGAVSPASNSLDPEWGTWTPCVGWLNQEKAKVRVNRIR